MLVKEGWYAIYVRSRSEKKVKEELEFLEVKSYLPLKVSFKQWSDRKKRVETPLISGYLFVYLLPKDYDKVLTVNNVVSYVRFEGNPVLIPSSQIDSLKILSDNVINETLELNDGKFKKGQVVKIVHGEFAGFEGVVKETKSGTKLTVILDGLGINVSLTLSTNVLTKKA